MTFSTIPLLSLFVAFFALALAPNVSVLIVTTRAATAGFRQGAWATWGIAVATVMHAVAALIILMIVEAMRPEARQVLKLLAAVYLIWSGMRTIRMASLPPRVILPPTQRDAASFATGFLLTALRVTSIVFYVCFIPVFVSGPWGLREAAGVLGVIAAAGFIARLLYVAVSSQGRIVPGVLAGRLLNVMAGALVAAAGALLVMTLKF